MVPYRVLWLLSVDRKVEGLDSSRRDLRVQLEESERARRLAYAETERKSAELSQLRQANAEKDRLFGLALGGGPHAAQHAARAQAQVHAGERGAPPILDSTNDPKHHGAPRSRGHKDQGKRRGEELGTQGVVHEPESQQPLEAQLKQASRAMRAMEEEHQREVQLLHREQSRLTRKLMRMVDDTTLTLREDADTKAEIGESAFPVIYITIYRQPSL